MDIRAIFYDYARGNWALPEFIHGLIDRIADVGLNGLWLYLEDVTQFIMPERFEGTLDLAELRRLDEHAKRRGVMLAPMLALLGHAEQSLAHPELAHLAEGAEPRLRGTFDPLNPETRTVLADVLRVAAETFTAPLIGLGCDECWCLGMGRNPDLPWPASLFCEHMNWLTHTVCDLGRRPMFFDDMIGRYYPEYAPRLDKRLIPVVWFYGEDRDYPTVRQWRGQGFDVIIFPSLGHSDGILAPMEAPATNLRHLIRAGAEAGALGFAASTWAHGGVLRFREREPLAYLCAAFGRGEFRRSDGEVIAEYWEKLAPGCGGRVVQFYRLCEQFGHLLPDGLMDYSPNAPARRAAWFELHEGAPKLLAELERLEPRIAALAAELGESTPAKIARPLATAALRARHVLALLRMSSADLATMRERIGRLVEASRREWCDERLPAAFERRIAPLYEKQWQSLASIVASGHAPPAPPHSVSVVRCHRGEPAEPSIGGLRLRGTKTPEADRTQVWLTWDDEALCIRAACRQAGPVRAVEDRVDTILTRDDLLAFQIDARHGHADSLWVEFNPAGVNWSQVHADDGQRLDDPRCFQHFAATGCTHHGSWELTARLPYAMLGVARPAPGAIWGFAVERRNTATGQTSWWGGDPAQSRCHPRALAHLVFE